MDFEEGDLVLCTVDRIDGTNVFVSIEGNGEGIIMTSEIAPGRIRNIRDYVVPKKKIVCKVLRAFGNRIELSLRRVTPKEQKEVMENYQQEKSYMSILNTILGKEAETVIKKILEEESLHEFFGEAKSNPKKLDGLMNRESADKIIEIINSQKEKIFTIKKDMRLMSVKPDGLELIKNIFSGIKGMEVRYISAGHYSLISESSDIKSADNAVRKALSEIEKNAKKFGMEFSIIEK